MKSKRFSGILLGLALMLGLMIGMSATAYADNTAYNVWIGGTQATEANHSGPGWSYDDNTATLTLNGFSYEGEGHGWSDEYNINYSAAIYADQDLMIQLSGTNSVKYTTANSTIHSGIYGTGNLTIAGSGTLNATCDVYGIYCESGITITGGEVIATGSNYSGIYVKTGDLEISGGTVTATGSSYGIYNLKGDVTISGGTVTANSSDYIGICISDGNVEISGGKVTATGKTYGIRAGEGAIEISGGTVEATGSGKTATGISAANGNVSISDGKVTARGKAGAFDAAANVKNAIAGTGWTDVDGTEGQADIAVSTEGQTLDYKMARFPALYPVWVGSTQVTGANRGDVLGDGTVSYTPATTGDNPTTAALTLNGFSYEGEGTVWQAASYGNNTAAIYADQDLTIQLSGTNSVKDTTADSFRRSGIYGTGNLTITGSGTLSATGDAYGIYFKSGITIRGGEVTATSNQYLYDIYVETGDIEISGGTVNTTGSGSTVAIYNTGGDVTISGGTVNATGGAYTGISANGNVAISGGKVTATGRVSGIDVNNGNIEISGGTVEATGSNITGISANRGNAAISGGEVTATGGSYGIGAWNYGSEGVGKVTITGGTVQAVGSGDDGVGVCSEADDLTIGKDITSFVARGKAGAFDAAANVKNAVAGTGWTDVDGTEGQADIAVSAEGQTLDDYKKVKFPAIVPPFGEPDFLLPASLAGIGEEAFEGAAMTVAYVPDGCASIGAKAFRDCANLKQIRLPQNCAIDATAFEGCGTVCVFAPAGGTTETGCNAIAGLIFIPEAD